MRVNEMIDVHTHLKDLRTNIRNQVKDMDIICDGDDVNHITDNILGTVLDWMLNNIGEIEFK